MEQENITNDREFTAFLDLQKMTDEELQEEYLRGDNIHISVSKASAAKRLLDIRAQKKQIVALQNVEKVTRQLNESNKELSVITGILQYFKKRWLPGQSWWFKVLSFVVATLGVAYVVNLFAAWTSFKLGW
jgi:hypothetical protein